MLRHVADIFADALLIARLRYRRFRRSRRARARGAPSPRAPASQFTHYSTPASRAGEQSQRGNGQPSTTRLSHPASRRRDEKPDKGRKPRGAKPKRRRRAHSPQALRKALTEINARAVDRRTTLGKQIAAWRRDLTQDLGGPEAITTAQAAVVDLAVRTKLLLDSIDAWLLTQPSLVSARKRALLPVVHERQVLADAFARYLQMLRVEPRRANGEGAQTYTIEPPGPQVAGMGSDMIGESPSKAAPV